MTDKNDIITELEINPDITYDELIKRHSNIKYKHFTNTRWGWRKTKKGNSKGKGKKNKIPKSTNKPHSSRKTEGGADPPSNTIDKVDESTIEQGLIRLWNLGEINTNLMRCMVDYVIKIRGKSEEADEIIDLEVLKQLGLNVKTGN